MKIDFFNEWTTEGLYDFDLQLFTIWYDNKYGMKTLCFIILNFAIRINFKGR